MNPIQRLRQSQRGTTLVLFTLMLPFVIIPLVGLGVDATMLYIVQAKLSSAVDGAVLGAGRLLGTPANPAEIAGEFLNANFRTDGSAGFWRATNLVPTISVTIGTSDTIQLNATADVPLLFGRIFGYNVGHVAAAATATKKDSRLMLVIDRSGSMNTSDGSGSTVIKDLVSYSEGFTQKFTEGTDELGLVVFDGSAVVGYPTTRPWDPTTTSTSTGGPNTTFNDGTSGDMVNQIAAVTANNGTGMAEALWIAYIELQKAHLRDLAANGSDNRQNSIILFTDGVPSAVSLYLNNPANSNAYNVVAAGSGCTNRTIGTPTTANMMVSWIAFVGPPYSTSSGSPWGMYLMASTDTTETANWWMKNGGADATSPNPTTPYAGCTTIYNGSPNSSANLTGRLTQIPTQDRWGNSMSGTGYTNSYIVQSNGSTSSIYNGTALNVATVNRDYHWGLAIWNSVDNTANNIRNDSNLANRAGDTQNMKIQIFTIGYEGNGGCDQGLLLRVANDPSSTSFNVNQQRGRYIPASNTVALANAFAQVASSVLRLSQ
jgi:Flp pilus assembly protein TadG